MLIADQEVMAEILLAMEDVGAVFPDMFRLPQISSMWHRDEENKGIATVYVHEFTGGNRLVVSTYDGDIAIGFEEVT